MKWVYAEGAKFIYLTKSDELPQNGSEVLGLTLDLRPSDEYLGVTQSSGMTDFRLAIMNFAIRPEIGYAYFLHWDDNSDLDTLDTKVMADQYSDEDFLNSIKTQFQYTKCFTCGWEKATLVVPSGDPYLNAPDLAEQKKNRRYQKGGFFFLCPKCDSNLRQSVVKIFA